LKAVTDATKHFKEQRDDFMKVGLKFLETTHMNGAIEGVRPNHVVLAAFGILRTEMGKYANMMDARVKALTPPARPKAPVPVPPPRPASGPPKR